ncbi:MAG TPA: 6-phosphofructokinase [Candidatus Akkermansia intestinavium]|nr:6-phosphofructokinase [Candidatus Akkermansia intestinavium]
MKELKGACIIGQSGGPTAVINASVLGAIQAALAAPQITRVLGAAHGITGVLNQQLYDMAQEDPAELELLKFTPASALGTCRYKMKDPDVDPTDYEKILDTFRKFDVRYFFYNGGNDSMDTCNKISKFMLKNGYECRVMGIPKTIDNDLYGTDHCPGFASAAKYIATSCMEVKHDACCYDTGMVTIVEVMGRHAGWLTAASALANYAGAGPDLIYLPEVDFDMDSFLNDVERVYNATGKCFVVVSEGIHDKDGKFISEAKTNSNDGFGHAQLGGLANKLAEIVRGRVKAKVRAIEPSLLQRCATHLASTTDAMEAYLAGKTAVTAAVNGDTDKMVAFERNNLYGQYVCSTKLIPLESVANFERKVPREWINAAGNGIEQPFIDYALPLIQGETGMKVENALPRFARLKKVLAKPCC